MLQDKHLQMFRSNMNAAPILCIHSRNPFSPSSVLNDGEGRFLCWLRSDWVIAQQVAIESA